MTQKLQENFEDQDFLEEEEDAQKDKYLTFRVAKEDYAIEIKYVREIIRIQKITDVPDTSIFVKGVINLRGKVIPVIDIRLRFSINERSYDDRTCIIVVNMNDILTGLIVDRVSEVIDIPELQVDPPPQMGNSGKNNFIQGMGKVGEAVKIILDINKLLQKNDFKEIENIVAES